MEPVACVCVSSTRHFASTSCNCLFWPRPRPIFDRADAGVEEDPEDDVEYDEDEEAEEDEEFDEEEFFENDDGGDDEEEEGDDSGDGTNGDGEYDRRSETEQLKDPRFDQLEWVGHRHGRSSSKFKFDLRESKRGRAFQGLSNTDKVLFCLSKTTNKRDAIDLIGDFGEEVRSVWTHRDSIGRRTGSIGTTFGPWHK